MRWVGKTTIAKALAQRIKLPYYDLDELIKDDICESIFTYIEKHGRENFREKEHESLKKILDKNEDKILALWWWTLIFENNQNILLKKSYKLIYLDVPLQTIVNRIKSDECTKNKRNPLTGKWLFEELAEVYEERKWVYESFYDFKAENIASTEQTVSDILANIWI